MNLILEINNSLGCNFDEKKLKLLAEKTIFRSKGENFFEKDVLISVAFVSENEIKRINNQFRGKNYSTDILSFSNFYSVIELEESRNKNVFLGELIICFDDIQKYCKEKEISFEGEFYKVFSHGILHLLGHNHGKKMFSIQREVSLEVLK